MKFNIATKIGALAFALVIVSAGAVGIVFYQGANAALIRHELASLGKELRLQGIRLVSGIDALRQNVLFLSETPPIQGIVRAQTAGGVDPLDGSTEEIWRERLVVIFTEFLRANPTYRRIRYIGVADGGREMVRVNRVGDTIARVADAERQPKSDMPYFQGTVRLKPGLVYLSDITLTREHGQVVEPHIPVMRADVPVYTAGGKVFGFVIIDVDFGPSLERLRIGQHYHCATNNAGDFLAHPDPAMIFGFDLGKRHRIQDAYPELGKLFEPGNHDLEYSILPETKAHGEVVHFLKVAFDPARPERFLGLVQTVPYQEVVAESVTIRNHSIILTLLLIAASAVPVFFLSHLLVRPLRQITRAAEGLGDGVFDVPLPVNANDEIGTLARTFRTMLQQVNEREEALRNSEEKYSKLFHHSNDGIFIHDLEGNIMDANQKVLDQFGYTKPKMLSLRVSDLPSPDALESARGAFESVCRDGFVDFEIHFKKKNCEVFPAEISASLFEITGKKVIQCIVRDITERKRAEEERARLASFPELSPNPVIETDLDGRITYLNPAACRQFPDLLTVGHEHPILEGLMPAITSLQGEKIKNLVRDIALGNNVYEQHISIIPEIGRIRTYMVDITERVQAEKARRASEERFRSVIQSANDAIISADSRGTILSWNKGAQTIFGYGEEEVLGKPLTLLMPERYRDAHRRGLERVCSTGKSDVIGKTVEFYGLRKDGSEFPLVLSLAAWKTGEGTFFSGIIRDTTEQVQAKKALLESNRRLQEALAELHATQQQIVQQERLRALGQMASGIAHDFNNALMPILGFSELLLDNPKQLDNKEKVTHYLQMMNTAAQDAAYMVSRLREFYRHREADEILMPVNLNQLVKDAIALTQPRWKDQALASSITISIETGLLEIGFVAGVESELREVLTNLIFNAVDAMPKGGRITITTRPDGEQVVLEVIDTGIGMTEEVRQRCMEPFFSTKGERGTGLGLAMVYGIIRRHNGTIDIKSEPGQGTAFIIHLPSLQKKQQIDSRQVTERLSRSRHVLVVEDEPLIREIVATYLTDDGHTVETAANGREGLEKFHAGQFDLVVTDRAMPEMSGDQLAAAIKSGAPHTPVILLTGFGDMMKSAGEHPACVDLIVNKPATLATLREALTKVK